MDLWQYPSKYSKHSSKNEESKTFMQLTQCKTLGDHPKNRGDE